MDSQPLSTGSECTCCNCLLCRLRRCRLCRVFPAQQSRAVRRASVKRLQQKSVFTDVPSHHREKSTRYVHRASWAQRVTCPSIPFITWRELTGERPRQNRACEDSSSAIQQGPGKPLQQLSMHGKLSVCALKNNFHRASHWKALRCC